MGGEGCEDIQTRRQVQHLRGESQGGAAAGKPVTGTARLQAPDHRAGRHAEGHQQDRERQPSRR